MTFNSGDIVAVTNKSSMFSMTYYAENRDILSCPCSFPESQARVVETKGNFVYVTGIQNPKKLTAFYHKDLHLISSGVINDD